MLLIACANVANLILARTLAPPQGDRRPHRAGRQPSRVLRQVLTESVFLSLIGGALGLTYAPFGVRLIKAFLADKLPQSIEVGVDLKVLLFTAAVSLLTGILAGILPALRLARENVSQTLKQGLGRTDTDATGHRTRSALVVSEVALSLVLLAGASLLLRGLERAAALSTRASIRGRS